MRIGFDVSQTCTERAGCAWFADSLARALAGDLKGNQLVLYHHFGRWINEATKEGTDIRRHGVSSPLKKIHPDQARELWREPGSGTELPGRPDIVHANNFSAPQVCPAKLVYTVYDLSFWVHPGYTTETNRLVCHEGLMNALFRASAFVFISEFSRKEFERLLPGFLERNGKACLHLPLAARNPGAPRNRQDPGTYWLAVGSLEPRKNYETLLAAMEPYWERSAAAKPLWICGGEGWKSEALRQKIEALEKAGKVKRLGYVPDKDLSRLYQGAFGLVFPSHYEGFGLPVMEAMEQGCPVICGRASTMPEIGGDAVRYADALDPGAIVQAMLEWEEQPEIRREFIRRGRLRSELFSWKKSADLLWDFYGQVLSL